jgi:hypothetical protein
MIIDDDGDDDDVMDIDGGDDVVVTFLLLTPLPDPTFSFITSIIPPITQQVTKNTTKF